jgi:hypothetical protein
VTCGGIVSSNAIATWNDALPVLPCASVAVHVTVVLPTGKVEPDAGEHIGAIGPSTASLAVAVNVSAFPAGDVALSAMSAGTVTTGGVVSRTVTWNEALATLPAASLAVHATVVVPSGNVAPDAGVHENAATATSSVADAE